MTDDGTEEFNQTVAFHPSNPFQSVQSFHKSLRLARRDDRSLQTVLRRQPLGPAI